VEGVRRDVRIVNLSLVNTPWYIQQMKEKPYYPEAEAVPISLSNAQIERISPMVWEPRKMELPVPPEVFRKYGVTDTALINRGAIDFTMSHTFQVGDTKAIKVQDIMVRDIIYTNNWKYPIYFAVTVSPDSKIGLDNYLWFHGLAFRLEPRKVPDADHGLDVGIVEQNLFHEPATPSRTPQYGYRYRGVADTTVYYDENTSKLMTNFRSAFIRLALYYSNAERKKDKAAEVLDRMDAIIPRKKIPLGWDVQADIANFYLQLGRRGAFDTLTTEIEPELRRMITAGEINWRSYRNPYLILLQMYEVRGDKPAQLALLQELQTKFPNDPNLKQRISALERELQPRAPAVQGKNDTAS
jgi:hypothetical protein